MKPNNPKSNMADADEDTQRSEIEAEWRLVKEYWLQKIQPYIAGRKLVGIELFVATDAYLLLKQTQQKVEFWNHTTEGRLSPIDGRLAGEQFQEPEALVADESLKPEILAGIAAPLMHRNRDGLTPKESVRIAHELLIASKEYIKALPEQKRGIQEMKHRLDVGTCPVTFAEVKRSNEQDFGRLPLLPPVQNDRNKGRLSLKAFKDAVKSFTNSKNKIEDDQSTRLFQADQISAQDLCTMRWERFRDYWQDQQQRVLNRKPPE